MSALKVEATRIAILPHRIELVSLSGGCGQRPTNQPQGTARGQSNGGQAQNVPQPSSEEIRHYGEGFDDDIPV